ncbi:MAG: hypothetical protein E6248_07525 [Clostridium sp.]|uniref:hypothetical protein n=1 Tax=Clostridium sp. TaxID=1506 RepID=UPI00290B3DFE|nr:hypothetical protein [Clostridium sp.]MDU5110282.1 hypothetical protein [Clostridium sp.]
MKKLLFIYILLNNLLISHPIPTWTIEPINNAEQGIHYEYTHSEGSIEELYKDIIFGELEFIVE